MLKKLVILWMLLAASAVAGPAPVHVLMQTDLGDIILDIDTVRAPLSAANFLRYVDAGLYNGGVFHRTVKPDNQPHSPVRIEVIQGGTGDGREAQDFPPVELERTNLTGLRHRDGTLSMARDGPDTATSDFFICIGNQPSLDFGGRRNPDGQGFAAFGHVLQGMDVVRRIQQSPSTDQTLTPPIHILRVTRLR